MDKADEQKFETILKKAETFYHQIGTIYCPYLQNDVHFSSEGLQHLLSKSWNRGRNQKEQTTRLRLLPLIPKILIKCHTLQEYDERELFVRQKINSRWEKRLKLIKYYIFIAIVKTVRLKIVIKEIEGGAKQFYSLYPSWKVNKKTGRKIFYTEKIEEYEENDA